MTNLQINDVRIFVPARDFNLSRAFYRALGWRETWSNANLAVMEVADKRFYLQNYYARDWAENFMLHLSVEDAHAWRDHVGALIGEPRFSEVRVDGPKQEPYGALVTYVWDPSGVLIHCAQCNQDQADSSGD